MKTPILCELYKTVLVISIQGSHSWIMNHDHDYKYSGTTLFYTPASLCECAFGCAVVDPGLRWGGQGAKFLAMTLCLGQGGPKVLFWYIFSYAKGEKSGPGWPWPPRPPWIRYWCVKRILTTIQTAIRPPSITTDWNTSVHITAFIPPCNRAGILKFYW